MNIYIHTYIYMSMMQVYKIIQEARNKEVQNIPSQEGFNQPLRMKPLIKVHIAVIQSFHYTNLQ